MKKYLSIGLSCALTLNLLSACSTNTSDTTSTANTTQESAENTENTLEFLGSEVKSTDILEHQAEIAEKLQAELDSGAYALENPCVIVDPYGLSPLTALALFQTEEEATISVHVEGLRGGESLENSFTESKTEHIIPIYGLYAEEATSVTITATFADGTTETTELSVVGGELPSGLLTAEVIHADQSQMAYGLTFVSIISPTNCAHALDSNGEVRWVYNAPGGASRTFPLLVLENGNFLSNISEGTTSYYKYGLQEFDLTGKIYTEYLLDGTQHDVRELPSGNFIVLADDAEGQVLEDSVYELDRITGEIVRAWDMDSYFDVPNVDEEGNHIADEIHGSIANDWFHHNSLDYFAEDDAMIVSGRNQDAILKFDMSTGELLWVFAPPENDLWNTYLESKLLTPVGDDFDYFYGQHNVHFMENGDILLFDNGLYRGKTIETILPVEEGFSRLVQYRVNEDSKTVEQIWQYGKERGTEILSRFVSGVQYIENGHFLGHFGGIVREEGGIPSYSYAIALENSSNHTYIIEIVDDEVVFEAHLDVNESNTNGNSYRSLRLDPYTSENQPTLEPAVRLGQLTKYGLVQESDLDISEAEAMETPVSAEDTGLTLTISNVPTDFEEMKLVLVGDVTYETLVELLNYQIKLVAGEVPVGTYSLYLEVDSVLYDLELQWTNQHTGKEIPVRYDILVETQDETMGEAFGSGLYFEHTALTITAIPKEGHRFLGWEENGEIISTEEKYSFVPTGDRVLTATFQ